MARRKPRRSPRRTRVLLIDGDVHVVVERTHGGLTTERLGGRDAEVVLNALDDVQYDLAAHILGRRRQARTR